MEPQGKIAVCVISVIYRRNCVVNFLTRGLVSFVVNDVAIENIFFFGFFLFNPLLSMGLDILNDPERILTISMDPIQPIQYNEMIFVQFPTPAGVRQLLFLNFKLQSVPFLNKCLLFYLAYLSAS